MFLFFKYFKTVKLRFSLKRRGGYASRVTVQNMENWSSSPHSSQLTAVSLHQGKHQEALYHRQGRLQHLLHQLQGREDRELGQCMLDLVFMSCFCERFLLDFEADKDSLLSRVHLLLRHIQKFSPFLLGLRLPKASLTLRNTEGRIPAGGRPTSRELRRRR